MMMMNSSVFNVSSYLYYSLVVLCYVYINFSKTLQHTKINTSNSNQLPPVQFL